MLVVVCWKGFRTSGRVPSLGKVLRRAEGFGRRVLVRENRLREALLGGRRRPSQAIIGEIPDVALRVG